MASNNEFQAVGNQGQLQGFGNLMHKENRLWWRTSRWWVQTLIWIAIGNGILFMVIGVAPKMENPPGQNSNAQSGESQQPLDILGLTVFLKIAGIATAIGVAVLAQDTLIGEKQSGTAAWVLSKACFAQRIDSLQSDFQLCWDPDFDGDCARNYCISNHLLSLPGKPFPSCHMLGH